METEYFMKYFSSAICYDMNIIRRAAVPFQPTRKAFSTNSECISVCWNSQKWKTDAAKDTTDISWRNHYQSFNSIFRSLGSLMETSEDSQIPGKEAIRRGGSNFLIAGPTSTSSPQITSAHCIKIPSDSIWEGGQQGQRGAAVGGSDRHGIWGQGGQAIEIQARDIIKTRKYNEKDSKAKANATTI